jgi:hypothetical protein
MDQLGELTRSELQDAWLQANQDLASIKEQLRMSEEDGVAHMDPGWRVRTMAAQRYKAALVQRLQIMLGRTKKGRDGPSYKSLFFTVAHELLPEDTCRAITEEAKRRMRK